MAWCRAIGMVVVALALLKCGSARAEWSLRDAWIGGLAGYDSNVRRVSATNPPPGVTAEGDARGVFNAGIDAELALERFEASLVLQPFYIKYRSLTQFDRLDFYSTLPATYTLSEQWSLVGNNTFRHVNFPERSYWNQTYNNLRVDLKRQAGSWSIAPHYRFMYRDRPSPNLQTVIANGVGLTVVGRLSDRVSLSTMLRYDDEQIDFVFPGDVGGSRYWVDVSLRAQPSAGSLIFGKYLYQSDETDFLFDPGRDLDKLGEGAEAASDDILQSIRFLEDRDFNFRKHLVVVLGIWRPGERHLIEGFGLFQDKNLDELVLSVPGTPKRHDTIVVGQGSYSFRLTAHLDLFGYARYEVDDSNDPDHEYEVFTGGIGLRLGRSHP